MKWGIYLLFGHATVVGGRHAVGVVEKTVEGGAGKTAEFSDERYRVGGGGQQVGSMAQTVAVDEVSGCLVGTFTQGIVDVSAVGAEESGQRILIGVGIGEDIWILHQFAESAIKSLLGGKLFFWFSLQLLNSLLLFSLMLLYFGQ